MPERDYHYVITIQFNRAGGTVATTAAGVITAGESSTRQGLYRDICKFACDGVGLVERDVSILFFTMGRNDLQGEE